MPLEILFVKLQGQLVPYDQFALEDVNKIPEGTVVKSVITVPRSVPQHRLLFAILNVVWKAQDERYMVFPTVEHLLDCLKIATGHVREFRDLEGNMHITPDSIAFAAMDGLKFKSWFDEVIRVILEKIIPGIKKPDLEQRIYDMLKEPGPDALKR